MKYLITICTLLMAFSVINAQEKEETQGQIKKQETLKVKIKETSATGNEKPDIYIDGEKFNFDLELIDPDKIESIDVIKGEKAQKEYNAPNGVLLIKTKTDKKSENAKITIRGTNTLNNEESPLIIIDGKVAENQSVLTQMSPDDIESIKIIKDNEAIDNYNAPHGVIIVSTKKGSRKNK